MKPDRNEIIRLLQSEGAEKEALFARAAEVRQAAVGSKTYLRGLIEYSNVCRKNCLYCGIRRDNGSVERYTLAKTEVLDAARLADRYGFGSVVLQAGELTGENHIAAVEELVRSIKEISEGRLGITLSLGEQTEETYRRWFDADAHRYLLRIETSSSSLYRKIHPDDPLHSHAARLEALRALRRVGYQTGTGVMIGLPFQTVEDLADDLLFMHRFDIDMCGMGPYLEHRETPLYAYRETLKPTLWRLETTFKMIALLRLLMPDINIAATTALQAIDPLAREKALGLGANVVMPNLTPFACKSCYKLYENKPVSEEISLPRSVIGYGEWGDSLRFRRRKGEEG